MPRQTSLYHRLASRRAPALAVIVGLYAITLWRTAWLSDDAYLSFRAADNLVHGFGPRWNVVERVQVFSNPLWTFVVAGIYALTREMWATALVVSAGVSLATYGLVIRRWRTWCVVPGLALLLVSRAFVDFSTSGLENPLLHLLLVAHIGAFVVTEDPRRRAAWVAWTAGLLGATRDDTLLLVAPTTFVALRALPWKQALRTGVTGLSPYIAWKLIALVYYGFPFPNTAYAKLGAGVPTEALARQGLHYFANAISWDPVTLLGIAAGLVVGARSRAPWMRAAAAGIVLYLLYLVRIGGDFMSARFFAAPLVVAVLVAMQRTAALRPRTAIVATVLLLAYGLAFARSPLRTGKDYRIHILHEKLTDAHGVTDERAHWHRFTNPACRTAGSAMPSYAGATWGREQRSSGATGVVRINVVGMRAFYAGPRLHVIEGFGLEDPLLARLPIPRGAAWRIGHFARPIPAGYLESLLAPASGIEDPALRAYDEELRRVTRGPLFDAERWSAIVRLNLTQRTAGLD